MCSPAFEGRYFERLQYKNINPTWGKRFNQNRILKLAVVGAGSSVGELEMKPEPRRIDPEIEPEPERREHTATVISQRAVVLKLSYKVRNPLSI